MVDDEDRFAAAQTSGLALLRVSGLLKDEAERCAEAQPTDGGCNAYFSAAGHLQVMAVHIVQCSRPEIFDVRLAVSAYLEVLAERPNDAALPLLPRCRA